MDTLGFRLWMMEPMLHLYYAALFAVLAANVAIVVIALAIRRVELRRRWPRGLAALSAKRRGDLRGCLGV
jgi:hypothetical protein